MATTMSEPIARTSLHDQVVDRLRDMIVEGELDPDTRINEKALCERFGISRTPLREALKVLASEGLVELMPNRGATVASFTSEDLDETFPIIGALEALSGEIACEQITDTEIAEIRALHYQMVLHYQKGELHEYFQINQTIHEKILAATHNGTLTNIYNSLSGRVSPARFRANMSKPRWAEAVEEHENILKALEARDGQTLSRLLKTHLANKRESVREALFSEDGAAV
ncbi:MAG: GntR family transcriptional regulator [Rhodospirillales bacterium]|nr:GntR family transcriptional regulator [Alphaproteobacteria bacterium]MBL6929486.1 GntR family transcriptional regulator [Rhodospirillales bacterium]